MPANLRPIVLAFRLLMAWTFIYAASHQVFDPSFSVTGFLGTTKTFHALFVPFTAPAVAPLISFLVGYGHLLIGLSLLVGLMVRVSSAVGVLLLLMYWMAHMDFPYVENATNFLVDYHIVYSLVLVTLIVTRAGHVFGLDGWVRSLGLVNRSALVRWATQNEEPRVSSPADLFGVPAHR
jgi:thiosulfate dehydrogenase (quinone) large subunit